MRDSSITSHTVPVDPSVLHAGDRIAVFSGRRSQPTIKRVRRVMQTQEGDHLIVPTAGGMLRVPKGCTVQAVMSAR